MIDNDVVFDLLSVLMISSLIATQVIQKIKDILNFGSLFNNIMALFISFGIGFIYSQSFYTESIMLSLWFELFTLIGSENFYKAFNGKFGLNLQTK